MKRIPVRLNAHEFEFTELQNALIIANGSDMLSMLTLTAWISAGIWLMIVIFTVKSFLYVRHR